MSRSTTYAPLQWVERQRLRRDNFIYVTRQSLNFKDPAATSKLDSGNPGSMHTSKVWSRPAPSMSGSSSSLGGSYMSSSSSSF